MTTTDDPYGFITIAVLTFCRPEALVRCLEAIAGTLTDADDRVEGGSEPLPVDSVMVIDNDPKASAAAAVPDRLDLGSATAMPVRYVHEPVPGVGTARNRAIEECAGRYLIFIDDDEAPQPGWPHGLIDVMQRTGASLVGGPVDTEFAGEPPDWIADGNFFHRPSPPEGSSVTWLRSGNLALDLDAIRRAGLRFNPAFRQGEDVDFSRRAHRAGLDLRWTNRSPVVEFVGPDRFTRRWRLDRERSAMAAWTRTDLELDRSPARRLITGAKASVDTARGGAEAALGTVRRDPTRTMVGRSRLARARGRADALLADRRRSDDDGTP